MRVVGNSTTSLLDYINGGSQPAGAFTPKNPLPNIGDDKKDSSANSLAKKKLDEILKKANAICDATKEATNAIRESTERLSSTDKDSLFAKAAESGSTKDVLLEINNFIQNYNSMLSNMGKTGSAVNDAYSKQLAEDAEAGKEELEAIGITFDKDGIITVDQEVLEKASLEDLQKVFGKSDSFGSKVSLKSIYIEAHAVSVKSQNEYTSQIAGYNGYGGYSEGGNGSGGYFNSRQ